MGANWRHYRAHRIIGRDWRGDLCGVDANGRFGIGHSFPLIDDSNHDNERRVRGVSTVTTVIATESTLGPLISLTGLSSATVNSLIGQAEAAQPEGALIELVMSNLGVWAGPIANHINSQFAAGQIVYQGQTIKPWPNATTIATESNGTVTLRWVKLQWWVLILVGLAIGVLVTYLALRALNAAPYTMTSTTSTSTSATSTSAAPPFAGLYNNTVYLFWLPWYWDLGIAGVLAVGPWAIERLSRGEYSITDLIQGKRALQEAER